jgi:5-methylcytosine-specific restriction endonuclease McrA
VDATFKAELDQLKALLSHKVPNGDLQAVLHEAVRCAIEKHGKRRGAVEPKTKQTRASERSSPGDGRGKGRGSIPAEVRREVWKRDQGRCTWRGPDGRRCESTWKLEVDHIRPVALGGPSTLSNTRLLCARHNLLHAEQTYGREHMALFRRGEPRTGEVTDSGLSDGCS